LDYLTESDLELYLWEHWEEALFYIKIMRKQTNFEKLKYSDKTLCLFGQKLEAMCDPEILE
jgi:hypothetical protein